MKKFIVFVLTMLLISTTFAGCRRNPEPTDSTGATPATTPATTTAPRDTTRPDGTGVLPSMTDLVPELTDGTNTTGLSRSHKLPRH